jgi:hypothetical protein
VLVLLHHQAQHLRITLEKLSSLFLRVQVECALWEGEKKINVETRRRARKQVRGSWARCTYQSPWGKLINGAGRTMCVSLLPLPTDHNKVELGLLVVGQMRLRPFALLPRSLCSASIGRSRALL